MSVSGKLRAARLREWAAGLTEPQRRLYAAVALLVLRERGRGFVQSDEGRDIQARMDACRKVSQWLRS